MESETKKIGATWWHQMITRRQANKELAKIGAMTVLLSAAGITSGCDSEDDEDEVQRDTLELQQKEGWNVGSTDKSLVLMDKSGTDSQGSLDWSMYLEPSKLLQAYQPKNSAFQPFVVPALIQSLSQSSLKSQISPIFSNKMREAYSRGLGMREILLKSKDIGNIMIISDIPGPESIAYAAALSDVAEPIITFDNWPHPLGVVKSQSTLGALLYYAKEVEQKAEKRKPSSPAVIILDSNRLTPYTDEDNQFDNRYIAKLPTADNLSSLKITSILYAVPSENQTAELDDINDDFAIFKEKGINISMLPLSQFQPAPSTEVADASKMPITSGTTTTGTSNTYYYGGHSSFLPYFFMWYAMTPRTYIPSYTYNRLPPTTMRQPSYTPVRRPTLFSSSKVGGAKGIGKSKPSGFGRVSTRVGSNGRTSGIRAGRSGSFGRSSGRGGG
jgi:hypothetical protein